MAKIKVWVSNQGEMFEGTQADLMRKYGIKQHNGFKRATGAVDANGDRWKEEGEEFIKSRLYLAPVYRRSFGPEGKLQSYWVAHSETACHYNHSDRRVRAGVGTDGDKRLMATVESQYEIVDNRCSGKAKKEMSLRERIDELTRQINYLQDTRMDANSNYEFHGDAATVFDLDRNRALLVADLARKEPVVGLSVAERSQELSLEMFGR